MTHTYIAYQLNGKCYLATLGIDYKTREDLFTQGGEKEIVAVTHPVGWSVLWPIQLILNEVHQHGITNLRPASEVFVEIFRKPKVCITNE